MKKTLYKLRKKIITKQNIKLLLSTALIVFIISSYMINFASTKGISNIESKIKPDGPNKEIYGASSDILGIIQFICVAILLAGLIVAGIGMVTNAGNPKKKADAKGALIAVFIGCILVFIPTTIIKLIATTSTNIGNQIQV